MSHLIKHRLNFILSLKQFYCLVLAALFFSGCSLLKNFYPSSDFILKPHSSTQATMRPYTVNGKTYYPTVVEVGDQASGIASWYGPNFDGKLTSNGERYDMNSMTAAHKTLPMNTMVRVLNLRNSKSAIVRINDRGPFVAGRIIDLSKAAAKKISMIEAGTAPVRLEVVGFSGNLANKAASKAARSYSGGDFMVQIGAFRKKDSADKYKSIFNSMGGYRASMRDYMLDGQPIYRVFLSGFRSEDEAKNFIDTNKLIGAFVVRNN